MKLEDFLLAFIYESWDIKRVMPSTIANILRLGADFKMKFEIEGKLHQEIKQKVRKKAVLREKQRFEYKIVEEMLERVDYILERYSDLRYALICEEIEAYLKLCIENNADREIQELIDLYNVCDLDTLDRVYYVINEMISHWKNLCKE